MAISVGEALAYGLLGGTEAAAEHYVEDWRDRTKRARDQAAQKEGWKYQTSEREAGEAARAEEASKERAFRSTEAGTERTFRTNERLSDQTFRSSEAGKERAFRADQSKAQQFGLGADGKTIVPLTPGEDGAMALPIGQTVGGKFAYLTGTNGKGLLKGGTGSSGGKSSASGPKSVKSGTGMTLNEGSVEVDEDGRRWQYVVNPQTNRWDRVPVESFETAPVIHTQQQIGDAEAFAQKTVEDLAGYFSTDATDFSAWGGSPEAAKEFFKRNYLNDTLFDEQGQLVMPGQQAPTAQTAATPVPTQEPQQTQAETQAAIEAASQVYSALSTEKRQHFDNALKYLHSGTDKDALIQRMLELGFSEQELVALGF